MGDELSVLAPPLQPTSDLLTSHAGTRAGLQAAPAVAFRDAAVKLGGRTIWEHVSFELRQGEFVALLGSNGTGKTTLMRALLGQIRLSAGEARVLGEPPRSGNRLIGYVAQRQTLESELALRVRDLVSLGLCGHRWGFGGPSREELRRVEGALEAVGALAYAGEPVSVLSGGEQQRVFLALALVTQPRILLLDEPLTSLDVRIQAEVVTLVESICRSQGVTVLFSTHDVQPLLGRLDRILYVLDGHFHLGTVNDVLKDELLTALYGTPMRVVRTQTGETLVTSALPV